MRRQKDALKEEVLKGLEERMRRKERTRKWKKIAKKYAKPQPVDERIITVEDDLYVIEEKEAKKATKVPKVLTQMRKDIERMEQGIENKDWRLMREVTDQRWRLYMRNLRKYRRRMEKKTYQRETREPVGVA